MINSIYTKLYNLLIKLNGRLNRIILAECGSRFYPGIPIKITGGKNIIIGNNFQSLGHSYLFAHNGKISIGDNLSLNVNVQIAASKGKIIIGNNVLIGPNVVIRAADHGLSRDSLIREQPHEAGDIIIEDDVWIGANAVILKNVKLGQGCVIAAGAVVNRDVEPYKIAGGVPARIISERV